MDENKNAGRRVVAVSAMACSTLIFLAGLFAPLTPSIGPPSFLDYFIFALIPIGLIIIASIFIKNIFFRAIPIMMVLLYFLILFYLRNV